MLKLVHTDPREVIEKNMAALKECYPDLAGRITASVPELSPNVFRSTANDAFPNILMEMHGEKILYYDAEDPMGYCKQYIAALDLKYAPALIFMGFGLGYQVVTILNDLSKKLNVQDIIIVEKDMTKFNVRMADDLAEIEECQCRLKQDNILFHDNYILDIQLFR